MYFTIGSIGYDCYGRKYEIVGKLPKAFGSYNLVAKHTREDGHLIRMHIDKEGYNSIGTLMLFRNNPAQ